MQLQLDWVFFPKDLSVDWWSWSHCSHLFDFSPLCVCGVFPSCLCLKQLELELDWVFFSTLCVFPSSFVCLWKARWRWGARRDLGIGNVPPNDSISRLDALRPNLLWFFNEFHHQLGEETFHQEQKISHARCSDWV